jgi:hypothetical protein
MVEDNTVESKSGQEEVSTHAPERAPEPKAELLQRVEAFHARVNQQLADKENFKILAIDAPLRQPYYIKWRTEANSLFRLTAIVRRRYAGLKS